MRVDHRRNGPRVAKQDLNSRANLPKPTMPLLGLAPRRRVSGNRTVSGQSVIYRPVGTRCFNSSKVPTTTLLSCCTCPTWLSSPLLVNGDLNVLAGIGRAATIYLAYLSVDGALDRLAMIADDDMDFCAFGIR